MIVFRFPAERGFCLLLTVLFLSGCVSPGVNTPSSSRTPMLPGQYEVFGKRYQIMPSSLGYLEIGIASWYGKKFHGRLTAMGETYDMFEVSAAHKTLPLPTVVKVTNLDNGRTITLRVNDRGPFHEDRVIDLSWAAAKALGFETQGTAPVVVEALDEINYPELVAKPAVETSRETWYLQVGAFGRPDGAEKQLAKVQAVLPVGIPARILTSETETAILYKVWIGPMVNLDEELRVEASIRDNNLGNPLRVKVE